MIVLFVIAFVGVSAILGLAIGFVSGFDRHMRREHGRPVRWSDLF
jgi:hypothetical protein